MTELVSNRLQLSAAAPRYVSAWVALDPLTAALTVRIKRPTTADPSVDWSATAALRCTIVVEVDGGDGVRSADRTGQTLRIQGGRVAGGVLLGQGGLEIAEHALTYYVETGFFESRPSKREEWAEFPQKRLAQWAKYGCRACVEIEQVSGTIATDMVLLAETADAPKGWQGSVAYQNAASAAEASGGDGQLSLSFTAGAGTDRVAFVFGSTARATTAPTSASVTYAGSISQDLGDVTNTFWRGAGGLAWDALIGSGAQTVAFASSGGTGTQFGTLVGVVSFTDAHQTTHGTVGTTAADSGTALSITLASPASDSLLVVAWNYAVTSGVGGTTGADQTVRTSVGPVSDNFGYWETQPGSAGGALTHTKDTVDYEYVGMGIELKAAAGGAVQASPTLIGSVAGWWPG